MFHRAVLLPLGLALLATAATAQQRFGPGQRVLLDAHNCYPSGEKWQDRIDRALATGVPLAIEQDLVWYTDPASGASRSIVSHGKPFTGDEPSLESYLFDAVRPIVERALISGDRSNWPLVVLNLDFKNSPIEHCKAIDAVLDTYKDWITAAPKTADIAEVQPLDVKPVLVLASGAGNQFKVFYEDVPVGDAIRVFGAARRADTSMPGLTRQEQWLYNATVSPDRIVPRPADNFRRWWNNSWFAVEPGGARQAGPWTSYDEARLHALVRHAHANGYWIRFYTLNGHAPGRGQGWFSGYNFGAREAAERRWRATIHAGVDFVATDMYEAFSAVKATTQNTRRNE